MIEVFKTDVQDREKSVMLIEHIQHTFAGYIANFDLDDCDKILRVKSLNKEINSGQLISLLHAKGFAAEVLP